MPARLEFAREAERKAADFLERKGYKIIRSNYRNRLGEIDIIAREKGVICFVEVKARSSSDFGLAAEAVSPAKQKQIMKAALCYLKENKCLDKCARFDVVCLSAETIPWKIELIRNAFELSPKFIY